MKKIAILISVALTTGFTTVVQATQKDDIWYAGAKFGLSQYHDTAYYNKHIKNNVGYKNNANQLGFGIFAGYQAIPCMGFELGYDWLGRMPYKGEKINGFFKTHGIQLVTKLKYPIMDDLDLYTRLGGMVWRAQSSLHTVNQEETNNRRNNHDTGISPLVAIGIEYMLNKNVATRLDYQWTNNIGNVNTVAIRPNNSMLSFGLSYRFGQEDIKKPIVTPALDSAPAVQTEQFTLKTDVLFNFNKATLKTEGKKALDQLYSELSLMNSKNNSIIVIGHTDRIGSKEYNQKLSERRAHSVVNYLVSKGIPANKIHAHGIGKSDPVTGNTCNGIKGQKVLISCLSADRRVEITVKGLKGLI